MENTFCHSMVDNLRKKVFQIYPKVSRKLGLKLMSHENWLTPHEKAWMGHETKWTKHEIWLIPHDYYYYYSEVKLQQSKIIVVHATQNTAFLAISPRHWHRVEPAPYRTQLAWTGTSLGPVHINFLMVCPGRCWIQTPTQTIKKSIWTGSRLVPVQASWDLPVWIGRYR